MMRYCLLYLLWLLHTPLVLVFSFAHVFLEIFFTVLALLYIYLSTSLTNSPLPPNGSKTLCLQPPAFYEMAFTLMFSHLRFQVSKNKILHWPCTRVFSSAFLTAASSHTSPQPCELASSIVTAPICLLPVSAATLRPSSALPRLLASVPPVISLLLVAHPPICLPHACPPSLGRAPVLHPFSPGASVHTALPSIVAPSQMWYLN